jgi:hypothetical protein
MTEAYDGRQVVGIDLHRRRSVIVRMTGDGRKLETVRITSSAAALRREIAKAGKRPRVVVEATYGWYWAADVLEAAGAEVHLAHPLGVQAYSCRRVKNDQRDAADLAGLLRMGRLPEARGRPAGDPRAAGDHEVPAQAGPGAHLGQGPGACGAGQARHPGRPYRHLRGARAGVAGRAEAPSAIRGQGHLAAFCTVSRRPQGAARAADSAARPSLPLPLPLRPAKTAPVGWREETREGPPTPGGSHEAAAI